MGATFRTFLSQAKQISGSATYDDTFTMSAAETYLEKNLEADLNYVRTQLKEITGETNWYDAPDITLNDLNMVSGSLINIFTFTGMDDGNDSTPTYSSTNYVTNSNSLETSIGDLDTQAKTSADAIAALDLDAVCGVGAVTDVAITVSASGSTFSDLLVYDDLQVGGNIIVGGTVDGVNLATFATNCFTYTGMVDEDDSTPDYSSENYITDNDSLVVAIGKLDAAISITDIDKVVERLSAQVGSGSAHTVPDSKTYTSGSGVNMDLYMNGQLLQCNTGSELRDYLEDDSGAATSDYVKFTFDVPENSYLTYLIRS